MPKLPYPIATTLRTSIASPLKALIGTRGFLAKRTSTIVKLIRNKIPTINSTQVYIVCQLTIAAQFQAKLISTNLVTLVNVPKKSKSRILTGIGRPSSLGIIYYAAKIIPIQTRVSIKKAYGYQVSQAKIAEKIALTTQLVGTIALKSANTIFFLGPTPYILPAITSAFRTNNLYPIPQNALAVLKRILPLQIAIPATTNNTVY